MKFLEIIPSVNPEGGGPIEGVVRMAEALAALGHETHIASLDAPGDPWVSACPVPTTALGEPAPASPRLSRWLPWRRYGYAPRYGRWLAANAPAYDAVIVNGIWNYTALPGGRVLPKSNRPYFVYTHGMLDPWFRQTYPLKHLAKQVFWLFSEGPLLNGATRVFFTTEDERVRSRNAFWPYRPREVVVGYGTADVKDDTAAQVAAFKAAVPVGERPFLLYLSRIHPKKGCDLLVRGFAEIAAAHPDLLLVMAGPDQVGWGRALKELAASLGVADRILWPGMLTGPAKWGAYRACEAFCLPSHQENFGVVVAEALACRVPVLITDKVNIWHEVEADGAGIVAADTQEGCRALLTGFLALSEEERRTMRDNARRCFLTHFEIGANAERRLAQVSAFVVAP